MGGKRVNWIVCLCKTENMFLALYLQSVMPIDVVSTRVGVDFCHAT